MHCFDRLAGVTMLARRMNRLTHMVTHGCNSRSFGRKRGSGLRSRVTSML